MDFNDLSHAMDLFFMECQSALEPGFIQQAEAVRRMDLTVFTNSDSMGSLHRCLQAADRDQSEQENAAQLIGATLDELEQSITRLEQCPHEVVLPRISFAPGCFQQRQYLAGRDELYRMLLEVNARMMDPDRDWPPEADMLKAKIREHQRCYEEQFPIIGVLACHTETLSAIEKQLDAVEDRLAANEKLFRDIGLHGERWLGEFCSNLVDSRQRCGWIMPKL
ncbi:uncharacterized protein LOC134221108 [Armigeres subalbatus]|uniref:uncharacterized protein LOC134221108 n=1 Tax=Armigeres subalbatus TaxID=124917 RepID=UPI002ED17A6F